MLKDGVILIDKPEGWTSHDVVAKLRGIMKIKKVGHTGTLDPMATGLLPVCFGKATRVASFLSDTDKTYEAALRLGEETDTQDATGKVLRVREVPAGIEGQVAEVVASFVGSYSQVPPMYSAIKVKGVPLYKVARAGQVIDREPREVEIRTIQLHRIEGQTVYFSVTCSKGTYVRTLCADIGERLGVCGHLMALRRVRCGDLGIEDALTVEQFCEQYAQGTWEASARSISEALCRLPAVSVEADHLWKIRCGAAVDLQAVRRHDLFKKGDFIRFVDPQGEAIAVGAALLDSGELLSGERLGGTTVRRDFYKMKAVLVETST